MKPAKYYHSKRDWRIFCSTSPEVRPGGISYRLSNGREGTITDPVLLRAFYYRIFYGINAVKTKPHHQTKAERARFENRRPHGYHLGDHFWRKFSDLPTQVK